MRSWRLILIAVLLASCARASGASNNQGDVGQAEDTAAQIELQQAVVAAKAMWAVAGSYSTADSSSQGLVTEDPSMCFVGPTTPSVSAGALCQSGHGAGSISVSATPGSWAAAMKSLSGNCIWVKDTPSGTVFGSGTPCTGVAAQATTGAGS